MDIDPRGFLSHQNGHGMEDANLRSTDALFSVKDKVHVW